MEEKVPQEKAIENKFNELKKLNVSVIKTTKKEKSVVVFKIKNPILVWLFEIAKSNKK